MKEKAPKVESKPQGKKTIKLKKKTIIILILVIAIPVLIFSGYEIVTYFIDSAKTKTQITNTQTQAKIKVDPTKGEVTGSEDAPDTPYWNFINMDLINVDFTELKSQNSDVAGWVTLDGTNINYPYVKTSDNDFYLTHDFNKANNRAGWLFMDFRNDPTEFGRNNIIYAHNMKDKTMFGSLKNTLNKDWFNTESNRVIKMSNEKYNTLWQIFSIYTIVTTNDYIQTNFQSDSEYQAFLDKIKKRSYTDFNTNVTAQDKILTLSTCHGSNKKLVVHAKLIKIATR